MTAHHLAPATISDGVHEGALDVEIHTMAGREATVPAWHVQIRGHMPHELRSPHGKALSVVVDGRQRGVGTLVDPHLIKGAGAPPHNRRLKTDVGSKRTAPCGRWSMASEVTCSAGPRSWLDGAWPFTEQ